MKLSKLFGMDIYDDVAGYRGKVFDLVINLEQGKIETITTEPLKARSKFEAKKIISEKSLAYKRVKSVKDIIIVGGSHSGNPMPNLHEKKAEPQNKPASGGLTRYLR